MIKAIRQNKKTKTWEFDYKDLRGKRKSKKGFRTKAEAEKAQAKIYEDLNKGVCPANEKTTFREAAELFMRLHASVNCKPSTNDGYRGYLKNHLVPYFGDRQLNEITTLEVKEFIKQMIDTGRLNSTINKYMRLMSEIYSFMMDSDVVGRNPLARIKSLKETKNDKIRALSTIEIQALLTKTKKIYPDFYPLLFTALFTGMRQGELMALTWDSINWITKKITIDKNYTHGRLGTPKTGKIRLVDMSQELENVLREWRLACPISEYNLVFPNSDGNYLDVHNMAKRRFKPALSRAGIEAIRFHDLRHTFASQLLAKGAPMKYVQHQLGHSSIKMTMDLYTHLLPEVTEQCVNLLDSIVTEPQPVENLKVAEFKKFGT